MALLTWRGRQVTGQAAVAELKRAHRDSATLDPTLLNALATMPAVENKVEVAKKRHRPLVAQKQPAKTRANYLWVAIVIVGIVIGLISRSGGSRPSNDRYEPSKFDLKLPSWSRATSNWPDGGFSVGGRVLPLESILQSRFPVSAILRREAIENDQALDEERHHGDNVLRHRELSEELIILQEEQAHRGDVLGNPALKTLEQLRRNAPPGVVFPGTPPATPREP